MKCTGCGKEIKKGENIVIQNGQGYHYECYVKK